MFRNKRFIAWRAGAAARSNSAVLRKILRD
jgi:hypothetical protein